MTHRNHNPGPTMPLASDSAATVRSKLGTQKSTPIYHGSDAWHNEVMGRRAPPKLSESELEQRERDASILDSLERERAGKAWWTAIEPKLSESGERVKVTATIPFEKVNPAHLEALDDCERGLAAQFGGWTRVDSVGGWINPETGGCETEDSATYSVSFPSHPVELEFARCLFVSLGHRCDQTWIHIEVSRFDAMHTHVGYYSGSELKRTRDLIAAE